MIGIALGPSRRRGQRLQTNRTRLQVQLLEDRCMLDSGFSFQPLAFLGDPVLDSELSFYFQIGGINNREEVVFNSGVPRPDDGAFRDAAFLWRDGRFAPLALSGESAPGGGIYGSGLLDPLSLNDSGDVAFSFDLEPFDFPIEANASLYRYGHNTQTVAPVVLPGTPAPGGGTFAGVGFGPHLNNRGEIAFAGVVPADIGPGSELGLGVGLFLADRQDRLRAIVRPGDAAPGGDTFDWAAYPWNNDAGDIAFVAHLVEQGPCPPPEVDIFCPMAGVYQYHAATGTIECVAQPDDPAPDGGVFNFTFFPRLNHRGDLVFAGRTSAHPGSFGLFLESGGDLRALIVEGDPVPGGGHFLSLEPGSTVDNPIQINNRGAVSFLAVLDTDVDHDGRADTGLFEWCDGSTTLVARTGTIVPGVGTIRHVRLHDTASNDRGQAVFWARLTDRREVMLLATPTGEDRPGAEAVTAVAGSPPSAGGSGIVTINGDKRTFAFAAVVHGDGAVTGQVQLRNRTFDSMVHIVVDCMVFLDARTVIVSGTVTKAEDPEAIGVSAVFAVRDNGEDDVADQITTLFFEEDCESMLLALALGFFEIDDVLRPIEAGNIRVRP